MPQLPMTSETLHSMAKDGPRHLTGERVVPNDAKLGLIVGMGLTMAAAVVFFAKEPVGGEGLPNHGVADASSDAADRVGSRHGIPAQVTRRPARSANTEHVIAPGDTLAGIAERHYGDVGRFIDIYQANRDRVPNPDRLPVGEKLRLP